MTQAHPTTTYEAYLEAEGLDRLIDFSRSATDEIGVFDAVSGQRTTPFPPEPVDLARLHQLIRQRNCLTVLEFGVGHSTLVIADALKKNQDERNAALNKAEVRNRYLFQLFSVDASKYWIERTQQRLPASLADRVRLHYSEVTAGTFQGQLCHYYEQLPDIVPDFIYIDGPFAKDVKGTVHGLSFQCDERTVMSGDLLLMEPTLLPGTCILLDGRTNNARFLARNLKRDYVITWDRDGDVTTFELTEERLGRSSAVGSVFYEQGPGEMPHGTSA